MSISFFKNIKLLSICTLTIVSFSNITLAKSNETSSTQSLKLAMTNSEIEDNNTPFKLAQTTANQSSAEPKVYIVEQSLPDFLRQAARRNGYQVTITSRVRGTLKKMSLPLDMEQILEKIASQFDLKWHFQQKQLYISVGSENTTRMIFLGETKMESLDQALEGAGLKSDAYEFTFVEDSNSVIVNGPASYIASVELITEALIKNQKIKKDKLKIIRFGNTSKN